MIDHRSPTFSSILNDLFSVIIAQRLNICHVFFLLLCFLLQQERSPNGSVSELVTVITSRQVLTKNVGSMETLI